jgi:hypothetical protein
MSGMHLLGPHMTTTRYSRKKSKNKSERQLQAEREHNAWLRKRGVHPDQLKAALPHDAKGRRQGVQDMPDYSSRIETAPTSDRVSAVEGKRKENVYTGDQLAGIGMLHKSNMVPVRKDSNDAKEIARMRRG